MTLEFVYETEFCLDDELKTKLFIAQVSERQGFDVKSLVVAFFDDAGLLTLNQQFLQHDTYTDIITFDETIGKSLEGNIAISVERVAENAQKFKVSFDQELHRVIAHGVLHMTGFNDKTKAMQQRMREEENICLELFHVEQ